MSNKNRGNKAVVPQKMVTGTIKELAGRVAVNGFTLGQPELSVLARAGFFVDLGVDPRCAGLRGKPAHLYEVAKSFNAAFSIVEPKATEVAAVVASTDAAAGDTATALVSGEAASESATSETGNSAETVAEASQEATASNDAEPVSEPVATAESESVAVEA